MQRNIQEQIKDALRSKDMVRAVTLRGVLAAFTTELKSASRKSEELTDVEATNIIKRLVKQRKDSVEQFEKGGRQDLADNEKAELKILEEFLPEQMSEEEVQKIAEKKVEEFNKDKSKMGQIIGATIKEAGGNADGTMVKRIVEDLLK